MRLNKKNRDYVFITTLMEFIFVMAFIFLIIAAFAQVANKSQMKDIYSQVNELSRKLKLEDLTSNTSSDMLSASIDRLQLINEKIQKPINITDLSEIIDDWDRLVFLKNKISRSGQSIDNFYKDVRLFIKLNGGTGFPICGGKGNFLADIELHDNGLFVNQLRHIGNISQFENRTYNLREFSFLANKYLKSSMDNKPECRFQVRLIDRSTDKEIYKAQIKAIENNFYKIELKKPLSSSSFSLF